MLRWYQAKLKTSPILTQALTTSVLFATGDVLAQQAVERKGLEKHDLMRTARMGAYGGIVFGPAATLWYQFLAKNVNLSTKGRTTVARVLMDQTIFASTNMAVFLSTMGYLDGEGAKKKLEKAYIPGLKANWMLWPAVQGINFTYVPLEHRVLVVNIQQRDVFIIEESHNTRPPASFQRSATRHARTHTDPALCMLRATDGPTFSTEAIDTVDLQPIVPLDRVNSGLDIYTFRDLC